MRFKLSQNEKLIILIVLVALIATLFSVLTYSEDDAGKLHITIHNNSGASTTFGIYLNNDFKGKSTIKPDYKATYTFDVSSIISPYDVRITSENILFETGTFRPDTNQDLDITYHADGTFTYHKEKYQPEYTLTDDIICTNAIFIGITVVGILAWKFYQWRRSKTYEVKLEK